MDAVISAAAGLIAGVIGSLIAPWVNWGIEKRRARMNGRRDLVRSAREMIADEDDMLRFIRSDIYHQLKPYLSIETNRFLSDGPNHINLVIHGGEYGPIRIMSYKEKVREDLSELERKWGIV